MSWGEKKTAAAPLSPPPGALPYERSMLPFRFHMNNSCNVIFHVMKTLESAHEKEKKTVIYVSISIDACQTACFQLIWYTTFCHSWYGLAIFYCQSSSHSLSSLSQSCLYVAFLLANSRFAKLPQLQNCNCMHCTRHTWHTQLLQMPHNQSECPMSCQNACYHRCDGAATLPVSAFIGAMSDWQTRT